MAYCSSCGKQNPSDARFCSQCGTRLVEQTAENSAEITATISFASSPELDERQLNADESAAVDALPDGHALLVVKRGPSAGARFLLDADVVTAGRHPESEIFLDDVTVSRRHAEFRREGLTFKVDDSSSLNGTYVNRDRIDDVLLANGDEVQIGKYRLVFFSGNGGHGG